MPRQADRIDDGVGRTSARFSLPHRAPGRSLRESPGVGAAGPLAAGVPVAESVAGGRRFRAIGAPAMRLAKRAREPDGNEGGARCRAFIAQSVPRRVRSLAESSSPAGGIRTRTSCIDSTTGSLGPRGGAGTMRGGHAELGREGLEGASRQPRTSMAPASGRARAARVRLILGAADQFGLGGGAVGCCSDGAHLRRKPP